MSSRLVDRAAHGDSQSMAVLLDRYRERLERMVGLRLDTRLQGRVGASDIVQEAMIEASRRLSDYAKNPTDGILPLAPSSDCRPDTEGGAANTLARRNETRPRR